MEKSIRLSGIAYESLVNGPGIRRVFFSQGCKHNCFGCFNPDTHDFDGGEIMNVDKLINDVLVNPIIKGVTFSGGDPLEQAEEFSYMAKVFKKNNLNIWVYTGYLFEDILLDMNSRLGWSELIQNIDVLVDGKFENNKKSEEIKFRGSTNQRIINVRKSLISKEVVLEDYK